MDSGHCLFCHLCVEACPFEALAMTDEYEIAGYDRSIAALGLRGAHRRQAPGRPHPEGTPGPSRRRRRPGREGARRRITCRSAPSTRSSWRWRAPCIPADHGGVAAQHRARGVLAGAVPAGGGGHLRGAGAAFLAAMQILIYVGAIMVLLLFALMLTSGVGVPRMCVPQPPGRAGACSIVAALALAIVCTARDPRLARGDRRPAQRRTSRQLGRSLLTTLHPALRGGLGAAAGRDDRRRS